MYALISPNEPSVNGYRVAQVADITFEVAEPLFWVECSNDIVADDFYYDTQTNSLLIIPKKPIYTNNSVVGGPPNVIA
jgi:hypothetical protein